MDVAVRQVVNQYWQDRFDLRAAIADSGVHVVAAEPDRDGAFLLRLDDVCIVAVPPPAVATVRSEFSGLNAQEVFSAAVARELGGPSATVHGPSWHGYLTAGTFVAPPDASVVRLDPGDPRLARFLKQAGPSEWDEAGFPLDLRSADPATNAFFGLVDHGAMVAAGNMTEWRGVPADVGLLTRADRRDRGLGFRLAAAMISESLQAAGIVRYRALLTNAPSIRVAQKIGFEHYGSNYVTRIS